jgi:tetratricopeptide (TPR) repeat protein
VLDELIRTFNIAAPPLTSDPLGHFANYLKGSLPQDDGQSAEADIYFMSSVVEYIEGARKRATVKRGETRMEKIRDFMRRSHFREAIRLGAAAAADRLSASIARDLLRTMLTAAFRLDDGSAEEIKGYELVISLADSLTRQDTFVKERVAMALVNRGLALAAANRHADAVIAYDEAIKRLTRKSDQFFQAQMAEAIFNKGFSLGTLGEHRQAVQVYGHLVKRFGHSATPELQEMVAMALLNQGYAFGQLGQSKNELRAYDDVLRRYSRTTDPDVFGHVARAAFQDLIARLEGVRSRELRELADNARLNLDDEDPEAGGTRAE